MLFVEERLDLAGGSIATDIKVHVCSGVVSHVWAEDNLAKRSHLFDGQGKQLPGRDPDYPREDQALPLTPRLLDFIRQAIALAPRIAGDLDHVRVDFLVTDRGLHAGEMCIYTAAGYGTWTNPEIARRIERYWRWSTRPISGNRDTGSDTSMPRRYAPDAPRAEGWNPGAVPSRYRRPNEK